MFCLTEKSHLKLKSAVVPQKAGFFMLKCMSWCFQVDHYYQSIILLILSIMEANIFYDWYAVGYLS